MVTTLLLPSWERINEYYLGDSVVFEAKKIRSNIVAVRSRNAGADSNLTVLGASGNVYNFYLRSETWNSTQVTDLTVYVDATRGDVVDGAAALGGQGSLAENMPTGGAESSGAGMPQGMPDYLRRLVFRPEELRFDMKMYARREVDAQIAPEHVFEDGVFTYFDFGEQSDSVPRPVVHQLVDGVDTVVNTRTSGPHGNVLIAEGVGDFTLRNGSRIVCVRQIGPRGRPAEVEIGSNIPEPGKVWGGPKKNPAIGSNPAAIAGSRQ